MREAVLIAHTRTALTKSFRGSFNMTRADDLLAHCIGAVLAKAPALDTSDIEDVIIGCGYPEQSQGMNIGRVCGILAGLPVTTAGATINRFCASGLQAVASACHAIVHEGVDVALAGGVESITTIMSSRANFEPNPKILEKKPELHMAMGDTAEVVAKRYNITRDMQDEYALQSQQRTAAAQGRGYFDEEIAPMQVTRGVFNKATKQIDGTETVTADVDECNRADTTLEALGQLRPAFDKDSGQGSVTAGNSSQLSDGASVCLLMSRDRAKALDLEPKLIFRGFAVAGCEPDEMGIGPVFAVPKVLKRSNVNIGEIDRWELNEAFASQVVYCRDRLGIPQDKLNVNGGSIAIGHPFGMTGSRMVGTLANQLAECEGRYGIVTMCVGGGQGAAGLFERPQ